MQVKTPIFEQTPFPVMMEAVKAKLTELNIDHHISYITYPIIPVARVTIPQGLDLGALLLFVEKVYPIVCLTTVREKTLYISFLARKDWLEMQDGS